MVHDPHLIVQLKSFPTVPFAGEVYRATRASQDPLAPSTRGGRWAKPGGQAVLYTSMEIDGACAELAFQLSLLTPIPTKPAAVHRVRVDVKRKLRLIRPDLDVLGVQASEYESPNYDRTQEIGEVVALLGCDGLQVPSARWNCENLVLFMEHYTLERALELVASDQFDWAAWARRHGFLSDSPS